MTFTITSGNSSYTLPLDPQEWDYQPLPRSSTQKTLGGQVVQLLGYSVEGSFGGLLHKGMVSKEQAWNDMELFLSFMASVMMNQKRGIETTISWTEEGIGFSCALGDVSYREALDTVGYTYSVPFLRISRTTQYADASTKSSLMDAMIEQVGFTAGVDGFHGGSMGSAMQWTYEGDKVTGGVFDASKIDVSKVIKHPITGLGSAGPTVLAGGVNSSGSDAQLSSDASTAEIQQYAHDQVLAMGWTEADFNALVTLWNRESGWNPKADNPYSDAYGIPQAMCDPNVHPELFAGGQWSDYMTNPKTQVDWGLDYIRKRYGSPTNAKAHSDAVGWY